MTFKSNDSYFDLNQFDEFIAYNNGDGTFMIEGTVLTQQETTPIKATISISKATININPIVTVNDPVITLKLD